MKMKKNTHGETCTPSFLPDTVTWVDNTLSSPQDLNMLLVKHFPEKKNLNQS